MRSRPPVIDSADWCRVLCDRLEGLKFLAQDAGHSAATFIGTGVGEGFPKLSAALINCLAFAVAFVERGCKF